MILNGTPWKLFQQNHHHILISWTEHSSAAVKTRETGRTDAEANDICLKAIQCLKYFSFILSIFSFTVSPSNMDSKHQTSFDQKKKFSYKCMKKLGLGMLLQHLPFSENRILVQEKHKQNTLASWHTFTFFN